jgi:undecaprenyl pyrophosphate phosphatase UppP
MMEMVKLDLDKDTRFLIWLDLFFLISIVSGIVVYDFTKNFISSEISVFIGLSIGVGGIIGIAKLKKRIKVRKE